MPLLAADDPLPGRPSRILLAGTSGSGKTTVAGRIEAILGLPHVELDSLHHGPQWTPREEFGDDVAAFSSGPAWVTEWQYAAVRPLLAARADLVVWLDLPRRTVMRQVVVRTLSRKVRRQQLWHGNTEPPLRTIFRDPEHIIRWAWRTHHYTRPRIRDLLAGRPALPVVRLRSRREIDRWLAGPWCGPSAAGDPAPSHPAIRWPNRPGNSRFGGCDGRTRSRARTAAG